MTTKYIQRKRVKGWRLEDECLKLGINKEDVVFCGRNTKYGNPYSVKEYGLLGALEMFVEDMRGDRSKFLELKGKHLSCWCSKKKYEHGLCHCAIIDSMINNTDMDDYVIFE